MTCSCLQTNPLPSCMTSLVIGTIPDHNANVNVLLRSDATGRVNIFSTTSSNTGQVSIDLSVDDMFLVGHSYTVEVKQGLTTSLPITIDGETETCVSVTFESMLDELGNSYPVTSQTLTLK